MSNFVCVCSLIGMPQKGGSRTTMPQGEGSRTTFDPSSAYCESRGGIVVD